MCRVGIVDYSVNGECGGGRGSVVKGRRSQEEMKTGERMEEKARKNSLGKEGKVGQKRAKQVDIWTEEDGGR
jgi:hypothetical protein